MLRIPRGVLMKLSKQEVKLLQGLRGARARRQKESVIAVVLLVLFGFSGLVFDWLSGPMIIVMGMAIGFAINSAFSAFSNIRADDRLNALLLRYVDSDAEALEQLAQGETPTNGQPAGPVS